MAIVRFNSHALWAFLAIALLAGCSREVNIGGKEVLPSSTSASPKTLHTAPSGDLLYVADAQRERHGYRGIVSILTFPQGKPIATIITSGFITGVCSDISGDVWVLVHGRSWNAYEFAHGGTTPIAKIHIPHPNYASGCAVDPTTGNLAIVAGVEQGSGPGAFADVWAGAREGKPTRYPIAFTPFACAYDDRGNFFVDGYIGSTVLFEFAELAKSGSSFTNITLDKRVGFYPGGVQWDGKYVALVPGGNRRGGPSIYRLKVSGTMAKVAGIVDPKHLYFAALFCVKDGMVAATSGAQGNGVALWRYPAGGKPIKALMQLQFTVTGLAISSR